MLLSIFIWNFASADEPSSIQKVHSDNDTQNDGGDQEFQAQ